MSAPDRVHRDVVCPFCGLACDDLVVSAGEDGVRVTANGCPRSVRMFADTGANGMPGAWIDGAPVPPADAIARAATILRDARQPLFAGLGTDVTGARAVLALADRIGATVDHMGSAALMRNVLALQANGWITTTFAEVKNRADLVVIAGTDVVGRFPRFFERVVFGDAMFTDDRAREIVFVGQAPPPDDARLHDRRVSHIACDNGALADVFGALGACLRGTSLQAGSIGGVAMATLDGLARRMTQATYGVLVWVAGDLDERHAGFAIDAMTALVTTLNETTRFAALPIGGNDGDITVNQVCLWQTGFPLRTSFAGGMIDYDPCRFDAASLVARNAVDALVWISTFDAQRPPPPTHVPTIVLGRRGMTLAAPAAVQIDVATPGLQHGGAFFRGDGVVALRLRKLVDAPPPAIGDVMRAIGDAL